MTSPVKVVWLWGTRMRPPSNKAEAPPDNATKGVRALEARGASVAHVYPGLIRERSTLGKALLGRRALLLTALPAMVRATRGAAAIHTSDPRWAHTAARYLRWTRRSNPLVVRWAGIDVDFDGLRTDAVRWREMDLMLSKCRVFINMSTTFAANMKALFPARADRMVFWPTPIDVNYFASVAVPAEARGGGIVAVGSDSMRDWALPLAIAGAGRPVTVLTEDPSVKAMIDALEPEARTHVQLLFRIGARQSAEVMARARCLLVATKENERFSGSTTVGVAAALGQCLLLDEENDLAGYGLLPGINCEVFRRGDPASALNALSKLDDLKHRIKLSERLGALASSFDLEPYAVFLEDALAGLPVMGFRPPLPPDRSTGGSSSGGAGGQG